MIGKLGTTTRCGRIAAMAAGAVLAAACAVGASAETIDQIYEAAKAEKLSLIHI